MRDLPGDRTAVRVLLLVLTLAPALGVGVLSAGEVQGREEARLPAQADRPFADRSPVVPPRNHTLVVSGHGLGSDRGALAAFAPDGRLRYYDDDRRDYFDVDPSPEGNRTVLYVASAAYEGEGECDGCEVSVVERANLTTGETETLHTAVTTMTWHDVERINETHYLVADIDRDAAFVLDVSSGLVTWEWRAQSAFPVSSGGDYPEDWTHINDVERLSDGRVMVSVRNQDQVVFVRPDGTVNESLGCDGCHDTLYEQHNPDYIPAERGGPAVLVADSENDRVVEYQRANGSWERTWVWTDRRMSWPRDADRLSNGRTLITDTHGQRVFVVNRTGAVVWSTDLMNGYDAELLATGDESAGGRSATALDYRSRAAPDADTVFSGSVLERVVPPKVRHAVEFVVPWYWGLTDVLLVGVSLSVLLVWGMIELYWAIGRARDRLDAAS